MFGKVGFGMFYGYGDGCGIIKVELCNDGMRCVILKFKCYVVLFCVVV